METDKRYTWKHRMLCGLTVANAMGWTDAKGYKSVEEAVKIDKTPQALVRKDYFLYFINAGPYTKIGLASNPEQRIKDIQVGCPIKIQKFRLFYAGEEDLAFLIERRIHKYFQSKHSNGEWFILDEADLEKIKNCNRLCYWNKKDPFSPISKEEAWDLANEFLKTGLSSIFTT